MSKPRFEGYDIIAESGDFLLVDAPAHALYPRRWSSYQVLAQLTVVCGEWHVGFTAWHSYLMKDIEAVAAAIGMFMGIPILEEDRILTLIKIKEKMRPMSKLPPDDLKYQKAVEKFERAKRRSTQDKAKGSRAAEAKIKDLQDTNRKLSDNVLRLRKMLAWMYRDLPPELRSKFDSYREALNNGTLNPDATDL